jgi:hypothetical protein
MKLITGANLQTLNRDKRRSVSDLRPSRVEIPLAITREPSVAWFVLPIGGTETRDIRAIARFSSTSHTTLTECWGLGQRERES